MEIVKCEEEKPEFMVFLLGTKHYTIPTEPIREIIKHKKSVRIPQFPSFIEGVINLRGNPVPVINCKKRLNLEYESEMSPDNKIIVMELKNHIIGLAVDAVTEVIKLHRSDIEPPPTALKNNKLVVGISKHKNKLLMLLNPINFLDMDETENKMYKMILKWLKLS